MSESPHKDLAAFEASRFHEPQAGDLAKLASTGMFEAAEWLCIDIFGDVEEADVKALLDRAPQLVGLRLGHGRFTPEAGAALAAHPIVHQLRRLDLANAGIKKDTIQRLEASPIARWAVRGVRGWTR